MIPLRFLLDTNVLSEPTKLSPNAQLMARLAENFRVVATAAVAYHELKVGYLIMPESRRKREMAEYIYQSIEAALPILSYCETAASWHAEERARLRNLGNTPPYADGQIAAIAATNQLVLVTRNTKDFQSFQGLDLENWFL